MIHGQTPNGAKDLVLRGWLGPRGKKLIVSGRVTTPDGDKQFWDGDPGTLPALAVLASPEIVQGAIALLGAHAVTTVASAVTASGGSEPYTYAWTLLDDDGLGGGWSALSPGAASSQFRASALDADVTSTASFLCTVTDARGATGGASITAVARNYGKT